MPLPTIAIFTRNPTSPDEMEGASDWLQHLRQRRASRRELRGIELDAVADRDRAFERRLRLRLVPHAGERTAERCRGTPELGVLRASGSFVSRDRFGR